MGADRVARMQQDVRLPFQRYTKIRHDLNIVSKPKFSFFPNRFNVQFGSFLHIAVTSGAAPPMQVSIDGSLYHRIQKPAISQAPRKKDLFLTKKHMFGN